MRSTRIDERCGGGLAPPPSAQRLGCLDRGLACCAACAVTLESVRKAQRALRDLGYSPGPIDGIVGPQTHAALAKYQDAEQLPVTGELDLETMARLDIYRRLFRARAS